MKFIIFYGKEISRLGKVLKDSIQKKWEGIDVEIFKSINSIISRMKRYDSVENEIYMFLVDTRSRLIELINSHHLIEDKKIILIVPDQSEETMRLSILLYPRYIAQISDTYQDLHLVLEKMIKDNASVRKNG